MTAPPPGNPQPPSKGPPPEAPPEAPPEGSHERAGQRTPRWLRRLDQWMAANPWHPRVLPYLLYVLLLFIAVQPVREGRPGFLPVVYLVLYGLPLVMLWRYRALTPELNIKFHWLAIPVAVVVFAAWVWLGLLSANFAQVRDEGLGHFTRSIVEWLRQPAVNTNPYPDPEAKSLVESLDHRLSHATLTLRLIGMALVVPLFEELIMRSLLLRSFHSLKVTATGVMQVLVDLPIAGDWLLQTKAGSSAARQDPVFGRQFDATPLGALSVFGVCASTVAFALGHQPRDYAGTVVCGVLFCLLLRATRHKGLGPVVWAHGITNALLWGYTLYTGDWQFL